MSYKIVVFYSEHTGRMPRGHWWWRLVSAGNNATIATSETYTGRQGAMRTAGKLAKALGVEVEYRLGRKG